MSHCPVFFSRALNKKVVTSWRRFCFLRPATELMKSKTSLFNCEVMKFSFTLDDLLNRVSLMGGHDQTRFHHLMRPSNPRIAFSFIAARHWASAAITQPEDVAQLDTSPSEKDNRDACFNAARCVCQLIGRLSLKEFAPLPGCVG